MNKLFLNKDNTKKTILYHYGLTPYKNIFTIDQLIKRNIKNYSQEEIENMKRRSLWKKELFPYTEHISLFFDRIPFDLVVKEFYKNPVYQKGNVIYEHQIDVSDINDIKGFEIVESPVKTFLLPLFPENEKLQSMWWNSLNFINKMQGNRGKTKEMLIRAIERYKGKTEYYFNEIVKSKNFSDNHRSMYAPGVPHLFLYVESGMLTPFKIEKIILS